MNSSTPDNGPYQEVLKKAEWISQAAWGICLLLLAVTLALGWWTWTDSRFRTYWWEIAGTVACFWLAYLFCMSGAHQGELRKTREVSEDESWLHDLAEKMAAKQGLRRTPGLRVVSGGIVPAYLSTSFLWGRPRIVLREDLIRRLERSELAAVMAHELAHARMLRRYYSDNVFPCGALASTAILSYVTVWAVHTEFGVFIIPLAALGAGALAFYCAEFLARIFLPLIHAHEYLADYEAARCAGRLNTIHALLKIGQRQEMLHTILEVLAEAGRLKQSGLRDEIFAALPESVLETEAVRAHAREWLSHLGIHLPAEAGLPAEPVRRMDWGFLNRRRPRNRLSAEEIEELVHALVMDGDLRLFNLHEERSDLTRRTLHPSLRRRLMFLCSCHHLGWEETLEV